MGIDSIYRYQDGKLQIILGQKLRRMVFEKSNLLSVFSYQKHETGYYLTKLTKQIDLLKTQYFTTIFDSYFFIVQFGVAFIATIIMKPVLAVVVVLLTIPAIVFPIFVRNILTKAQDELLAKIAKHTSQVVDVLSGFNTVKLLRTERNFGRRYAHLNNELTGAETKQLIMTRIVNSITNIFGEAMELGAWIIGAYFVMHKQLTIGQLVAFSQLVGFIGWPLQNVAQLIATYYGGRSTARELSTFLSGDKQLPKILMDNRETDEPFIKFENINLKIGGHQILKDIHLKFSRRAKTIIVGASGSGKSTLMHLLMKFQNDYTGSIYLNGQMNQRLPSAFVNSKIGYLEQDNYIFHGTVRENVTMFDDSYKDEVVYQALRDAGLTRWLDKTHDELDVELTNSSATMSGGEKQRIALARLLIRQYKYFIFDELSTGLDPITANDLEDDLFKMTAGFILITHHYNASIFKKAEQIIVMSDGCVVANGDYRDPCVQTQLAKLNLH